MLIPFFKYQGTGNDFIMVDNRNRVFDPERVDLVRSICNRRFGIGADGLILLQSVPGYDFEMVYFNADGNISSMCGNGGRCITAFARKVGIITDKASFIAVDGPHTATIDKYDAVHHLAQVSLKMADVKNVKTGNDYYFLNTGSPHYITYVNDVAAVDVDAEGRKIRNSPEFRKEGTNVNFISESNGMLHIRTYERGVEAETLSCGTGVTAAALVAGLKRKKDGSVQLMTEGGQLDVAFEAAGDGFKNIFLIGPAAFVFEGVIPVKNH
jgi:diaminopimelate epimerase